LLGGFLAAQFFNMPDAVNGFNLTSIVVAFLGKESPDSSTRWTDAKPKRIRSRQRKG
jgi:hypothetical protein